MPFEEIVERRGEIVSEMETDDAVRPAHHRQETGTDPGCPGRGYQGDTAHRIRRKDEIGSRMTTNRIVLHEV